MSFMLVPIDFSYTLWVKKLGHFFTAYNFRNMYYFLSIISFAIRFALSHFLLVFHWNWASISSNFLRHWALLSVLGVTTLTFQGHSTSSVTSVIRFAMGHFLLVVCWYQVSIS